ncbi:Werner syndrome-like exonuclease [Chlorella sorokiniana]|uniref:3'-5' exonuclease n=1 Tax=Chlorella sorokiniana TaxID=3076 RepID=A0A2P6TT62_CHLSO|nr:Werner syndrome-like exonuclease [Chlorella sorokiniana]|eukprot:PRW57233.1 Werner syndrome-like exonuclease [Chlorella sorokiniana]
MSWDDDDDWTTITPSQEAALQALERSAGGGGGGGGAAPAAQYQAPPAAQPAAVTQAAGPPAPAVRRRKLPAILSGDAPPGSSSGTAVAAAAPAAGADENLPPARFAGRLCYAHTGYEVEQLCQQLLQSGIPAIGLDIEWRVLYQTGVPPRPVALMQLCFRCSSQSAAAPAGSYTCQLLHICHSGITPHLRQLLTSPDVLKVGVGIHGDSLKIQRDFGIEMQGILCLSEYANARLVAPLPGADPAAGVAAGAAAAAGGAAAGGAAAITAGQASSGSGSVPYVACPQKWSLAGLVSLLLRLRLEKSQAVRCSNWEARPPLSGEQQAYAATDAWASLRVYEVLSKLPVVAPPPLPAVPAAPASTAQQLGSDAAGAAAMPAAADWMPACARLGHVQPAKLAVYQALVHQGLSVQAIAAQRRIQEDSVQGNMAAAIAAGLGYSWSCLGVPTPVLQQVAEAAVEDKDLTAALRRTFLLPSGEPRQGLTLHDKRQGLILFLHCVRHKLQLRGLELFDTPRLQPLKQCLLAAVDECSRSGWWWSPDPTSRHLGALSRLVLSILSEEPDSPKLRKDVSNLCGRQWSSGDAAKAAALEAGLRAQGHEPLLTAEDQEQLTLLLLPYAIRIMSAAPQPPQLMQPSAVEATRSLIQKEPGSALLKNLHAFMLALDPRQASQAAAAYRAALQAAQATNSAGSARFTIKPFARNTEIEQAYFAAGSYPLAPTLAAPWRDIPACVKAVEAVVAAFQASPARKEWEAAAVEHQRKRRRGRQG